METFAKRFERKIKSIEYYCNTQYKEFLKRLKRDTGRYSAQKGNYHPHKHTIADTLDEARPHPKRIYNRFSGNYCYA